MKISGYKLREAIKIKQIELSAIESQFNDSLYKFSDEKKISPQETSQLIVNLEKDISLLQTAQSYYNLQVKVTHNGEEMYLENAVKVLGGLGRDSRRWRDAANTGTGRIPYARHSIRNKDEIVAEATISKPEAIEKAKTSEKLASSLRSSIAIANATSIEIDFLQNI